MVAMKKTLLEIVQDILSSLDGDTVNGISDTEESDQITDIVISTYFDLISNRVIPEHYDIFKLTAAADNTRPTHLILPDDVSVMTKFWYNKSTTSPVGTDYDEVFWMEPVDFLGMLNNRNAASTSVTTAVSLTDSTPLLVYNDRMPQYYTSFDNKYIVCDAYKSTIDTTLQSSKTQGYGELIPEVTRADAFVFDIESKYFPYLIAEAKSTAFAIQQKTTNPKIEQWARRHKNYIQKEKYRVGDQNQRRLYGRS